VHAGASRSGTASAVATRRQVSSIVLSSISPEGPLRRYFMSQICCDIEPTSAMAETSSCRRQFTTVPDSFGADFPPDQICVSFVTAMSETLYDEDFYCCTQQQAG